MPVEHLTVDVAERVDLLDREPLGDQALLHLDHDLIRDAREETGEPSPQGLAVRAAVDLQDDVAQGFLLGSQVVDEFGHGASLLFLGLSCPSLGRGREGRCASPGPGRVRGRLGRHPPGQGTLRPEDDQKLNRTREGKRAGRHWCGRGQNPTTAPRYDARMTGEGLRQNVVRLLRTAVPGLQLALLYGSHARGDATPASDVDVAVLAPGPLAPALAAETREVLEHALGRDVHLVDLRTASTVLRHEVTRHGEVLHTDGSDAVEQFLDFALRDYVRLNEERAGILQDIRERGRVHGR